MASGDGVKFPLPITFDDDDPKAGSVRLILTVREMEIKKKTIGKSKPTNADITVTFDNSVLFVQVTVKTTTNGEIRYEYKKNLPYDINEKACKYKVNRANQDSQIIVFLAKQNPRQSWAGERHYFLQPPTANSE